MATCGEYLIMSRTLEAESVCASRACVCVSFKGLWKTGYTVKLSLRSKMDGTRLSHCDDTGPTP